MRQITSILLLGVFLTCSSCRSNNDTESNSSNSQSDAIKEDLGNLSQSNPDQSNDLDLELLNVFTKAVNTFPNDSSSLYRFYFKWHTTKDPGKIERQVRRLETLISQESVNRYNTVEENLKPLMRNVVKSNSIIKSRSDSLVTLYCDYDYFSGESLFSKLLTEHDNYKLVWKSFEIMSKESRRDTCFISALISLDNCISTNVELAEAMPGFIVNAIQNNPEGFLDMYNARKKEMQAPFASYISIYDEPDENLIRIFTEISRSSKNEDHRKAAVALRQKVQN